MRGQRRTGHRRRRRLHVADLHPNLLCILCGGYYVDATTIVECLHSFCRTCIVRYLESSKFCPICDVQVHKTRPLLSIRPDKTLQDIVYKLVPGLYQHEMCRRREFYKCHDEKRASGPEDGGCYDGRKYVLPDDPVSLALTPALPNGPSHHNTCYSEIESDKNTSNYHSIGCSSSEKERCNMACSIRYLQCPAGVSVGQLKRLLRAKFGVVSSQPIALLAKNVEPPFSDHLTLVDVAYITSWQKTEPLQLQYCIYERGSKTLLDPDIYKSECSSECYGICEMPKLEPAVSVDNQTYSNLSDRSAIYEAAPVLEAFMTSPPGTYETAPVLEAFMPSQGTQSLSLAPDDTYAKYMKQYLHNRNNNFDLPPIEALEKCQTKVGHGNVVSEDHRKSYLEQSQSNLSYKTFCDRTQTTFVSQFSHIDLNPSIDFQNKFQYPPVPDVGISNLSTEMGNSKTAQSHMPLLTNRDVENISQKVYNQASVGEGKEVQLCISETGVMSVSGSDATDHWLNSIGTEACELLSKIESEAISPELNVDENLKKEKDTMSLKRKDDNDYITSGKKKKVDILENVELSPGNKGDENKRIFKKVNKNLLKEDESSRHSNTGSKDKEALASSDPVIQKDALSNLTDKIDIPKNTESSNKIDIKKVTEIIHNDSKKNQEVLITNDKTHNIALSNAGVQNKTKTNFCSAKTINSKDESNKDTNHSNNTRNVYGSTKNIPVLDKSEKSNSKQNTNIYKSSSYGSSKKDMKGENSKTHKRSQPYGYKTLKTPPKSWNPTISREKLAFGSSKTSNSNSACNPPRTNKIFKARNAPKISDNSSLDKSFIKEVVSVGNLSSGSNLLHNRILPDKKVDKKFTKGDHEINSSLCLARTSTIATTTTCMTHLTSIAMPTASIATPIISLAIPTSVSTSTTSIATPTTSITIPTSAAGKTNLTPEIYFKSESSSWHSRVPITQTQDLSSIKTRLPEDSSVLTNKSNTTFNAVTSATNESLSNSRVHSEVVKKCDVCSNISQNINHNIDPKFCICKRVNYSDISKDNIRNITSHNAKNKYSDIDIKNDTEGKVNSSKNSINTTEGFNEGSSLINSNKIKDDKECKTSNTNNEGCGIRSFGDSNSSNKDIKVENVHIDSKIQKINVNKNDPSILRKDSYISDCTSQIEKQNEPSSSTKSLISASEGNHKIINNRKYISAQEPSTHKFSQISAVRTEGNATSNASEIITPITTSANSSISKNHSQTNNVESNNKTNHTLTKQKEAAESKNVINVSQGEKSNAETMSLTNQADMCTLVSIPKVQTSIAGSNIFSFSQPQFSLNAAGSLGLKLISPAVTFPGVVNTLALPCYSNSISYPQFPYVYSGSNTGLFHPSASFIPSYSGCLPSQGIATANLLTEVPPEGPGSLPIIPLISPINSTGCILTSSASSLGSILTPTPFQTPPIVTTSPLPSEGLTLTSVTATSSSITSNKLPVFTSSAASSCETSNKVPVCTSLVASAIATSSSKTSNKVPVCTSLTASSSAPMLTTSSLPCPLTVPVLGAAVSTLVSSSSVSKQSSSKIQTSTLSALKVDTTSTQIFSTTANLSSARIDKQPDSLKTSGHDSPGTPKIAPHVKSSDSSVKGTISRCNNVKGKPYDSQSQHVLEYEAKVPGVFQSESDKNKIKMSDNLHRNIISDKKAPCQTSNTIKEVIQNPDVAQTKSFGQHSLKHEIQSEKKITKEVITQGSPITAKQSLLLLERNNSPSSNIYAASSSIKPVTVSQQQSIEPLTSSQKCRTEKTEMTQRTQSPYSFGKSKDVKVVSQLNEHNILTTVNDTTKTLFDPKLCTGVNTGPSVMNEQNRKLFSHANALNNWQCDINQSTQISNVMQNNQLPSTCPSMLPVDNSVQGHFSKFNNFFNLPYTAPSYNANQLHPSLEAISQLLENENFIKPDKNKVSFSSSVTPDIYSVNKNALQLGPHQPESCQLPGTFMPYGTHSFEKANAIQRNSFERQLLQKQPNMSELAFPVSPFPMQVPNISGGGSTMLNKSLHSIPTSRSDPCQVSAGNVVFDALNVFGASPLFTVPVKSSSTTTTSHAFSSVNSSENTTSHASSSSKTASQCSINVNNSSKGNRMESTKNHSVVEAKVSTAVDQSLLPNNMSVTGSNITCNTSVSGSQTPNTITLSGSHTPYNMSVTSSHTPNSKLLSGSHTPNTMSLSGTHTPNTMSLSGLHTPNNILVSGTQEKESKMKQYDNLQNNKKHQMNYSEKKVNPGSSTKLGGIEKSDSKLVPSKGCLPFNANSKEQSNA